MTRRAESGPFPREDSELAPALETTRWFNAPEDFSLDAVRGRVVALHAFQMLCPGCVAHGLPQAQRIQELFDSRDVVNIGLHAVFEHHEAMTPTSLAAFLHEYRVTFPVGVDAASETGPTPRTMTRYRLRGTPSLLLIDREGRLRYHAFGRPSDMEVGGAIAVLAQESAAKAQALLSDPPPAEAPSCTPDGCALPTG